MSVIAPTFRNLEISLPDSTRRMEDVSDELKAPNHEIFDKKKTSFPQTASNWSPAFHLKAPSGWLNDPCGLGYDPSRGLYHVSFQWNPKGNDWGNVSWCHSTSDDLVSWTTSAEPSLAPLTEYDQCGVFTGCLWPTDISGNPGALTAIYTSVKQLPIHYTIPYARGCESLSLAVSCDGGTTWKRQDCNPVLPGPPSNVQVTGWRDPYIGPWPSATSLSNISSSTLYGFLSGGIIGKTPTVFVYAVNPKDLRDWKYTGHLVDVGLNFRPSRWSGDFGVNWEVSSVLSLSDRQCGVSRNFVIMGTEGCIQPTGSHRVGNRVKSYIARTPRQQLWMSLKERPTSEKTEAFEALMTHSFAGVFDHGCFYAANSFYDPKSDQHLVYGWITEEDLPDDLRHAQGWSGMISAPRAVKLTTLCNVTRARQSELKQITSIETEPDGQGAYIIRTLGIQPEDRLKKLRNRASRSEVKDMILHHNISFSSVSLQTSRWEVDAEFAVDRQCSRVGIQIAHGLGK